jgi:hypothetical protein
LSQKACVAIVRFCRNLSDIELRLESRIGFGIVRRLALLKPFVELAGVSVDRRSLLVLVATDGKAFGLLPALYGANFPAEVDSNLFPRNEFLVVEARRGGPIWIERCSVSRHERPTT